MAYKHLIPYANAAITQIAGGGFTEDGGSTAGGETPKWTGSADAWLGETSEVADAADDRSELIHDAIMVAEDDIGSITVALDDSVTYTHSGGPATTRKVRNVELFDAIGLLRLTFRDA